MKTKTFHLGDILSITTGLLVAPEGIDGVYKILSFMMGDRLFTHQLPRAGNQCEPYLEKQFPELTREKMQTATDDLEARLKDTSTGHRAEICMTWLAEQVKIHGEYFEVDAIPEQQVDHRDPIEEMKDKFKGKIINNE